MVENDPIFLELLQKYCCRDDDAIISTAREIGLSHINDGLFAISNNPVVIKPNCPIVAGITGLSGAGKDAVSNELVKSNGYGLIKSHTTREKRKRDIGDPYIHISREEFEKKIEGGDFIEFFLRGSEYMGLERNAVDVVLKNGKTPIIRTGPQAISKLPNLLLDLSVVSFFVIPQSWRSLQKRLVSRDVINCFPRPKSEAREDIRSRLKRNQKLLEYIPNANFLLINRDDKIDEAVNNIKSVLNDIVSH